MKSSAKNYHVVPRDGGWAVRSGGSQREAAHTLTQREAIEKAREIARTQSADIIVHNNEGRILALISAKGGTTVEDYYLTDRIAVSQDIVHGKPRIAGTRIMVSTVLDLLAAGKTIEEIISDDYYPDITSEDVLACIAYASTVLQSEKYAPADTEELSLKRSITEYWL
jgi:uncharacterized protein (DUF433 family)